MKIDKCWRQVDGIPMIARVLQAVAPVVDQTFIVGGSQTPEGIQLVHDTDPGAGPLAAIATGMRATEADLYLIVACDIPLVTSELLQYIVDSAAGVDAVVPMVAGFYEPLCAMYARQCLPAINQALASGRRRADSFFPQVQVRRIMEAELSQFGPPKDLLLNVNTPEELARVEQLIVTMKPDGSHSGFH